MIRPDLIAVQAKSMDFPLWRQMIRDNRERFNNIIIVFMESNRGYDYREFIKEAMFPDFVQFLDSPPTAGKDWRDVAVNAALQHSLHAEWIWFTEQDFFFTDLFWKMLDEQVEYSQIDYAGTNIQGRLHPCNILVRRTLMDQTSKDFSARPDEGYDHFGLFQKELEGVKSKGLHIDEFYQMGPNRARVWEHLNGITHNFTLLEEQGAPNYEPERFKQYIKDCLKVDVPMNEYWTGVAQEYLRGDLEQEKPARQQTQDASMPEVKEEKT